MSVSVVLCVCLMVSVCFGCVVCVSDGECLFQLCSVCLTGEISVSLMH